MVDVHRVTVSRRFPSVYGYRWQWWCQCDGKRWNALTHAQALGSGCQHLRAVRRWRRRRVALWAGLAAAVVGLLVLGVLVAVSLPG